MNEIDIFNKLASNLTEHKSTAALSNYEVLCNNISFVHGLYEKSIVYFSEVTSDLKEVLQNNDFLKEEFQEGKQLNLFSIVIPRLLSNDIEVIKKLSSLTMPDKRANITVENVGLLHRGFNDYSNLVTGTRQFIDSLITDAYQLFLLEPKEFNYHVLLSLNSFEKYATKSIKHGLFNNEIEEALSEFKTLQFRDWKNSDITQCQHISFANKVDFIFTELNKNNENDNVFKEEIKNLFKFSSEFTHIGYISTFFSSQNGSEVIFGGDESPYLPSTENFSELKYQILESCVNFIYQIYFPVIKLCVSNIIKDKHKKDLQSDLNNLIKLLENGIKTRNNNYFFFVRSSLIKSNEVIELPCLCGCINYWKPPHQDSELFCKGCGSSYNILAMDGDPGYIITSNGPIKVIGSDVPDFKDLPLEKQNEMMMQVADFDKQSN